MYVISSYNTWTHVVCMNPTTPTRVYLYGRCSTFFYIHCLQQLQAQFNQRFANVFIMVVSIFIHWYPNIKLKFSSLAHNCWTVYLLNYITPFINQSVSFFGPGPRLFISHHSIYCWSTLIGPLRFKNKVYFNLILYRMLLQDVTNCVWISVWPRKN